MFGFNHSFKIGSGIQVKYPVGGSSNILKNRLQGTITRVGMGKCGAYVKVAYRDNKTNAIRHANLSVARMIDPVVFSN